MTATLMFLGTLFDNRDLLAWGIWTVAPASVMALYLLIRRERLRVEQIMALVAVRQDSRPGQREVSRVK